MCGLYSVLNAIQLARWRVSPSTDQQRELLKFGVRFLTKRRLLARAMAMGLDEHAWVELSAALVDFSNELLGGSLALQPLTPAARRSRLLSASATIEALKRHLSEGSPVLCGFGGALHHYTVVAGYSEQRLSLFDSSGFRWVEQRSIGSSEKCGKRHWIYATSAHAVVDEW